MFALYQLVTSPIFWIIGGIIAYIVMHHVLFFMFKYKGPAKGERLFFQEDRKRFRINFSQVDEKSPLVIFESHLGMPLEIWSWAERELSGLVSTLSYDRMGYGWSSIYLDEKRDLKLIASDLLRILLAIPVLYYNQKGDLVGHAFGGVLAQIFSDMYDIPIRGIILLDTPPPSLLYANPLKDTYTVKLASIFSMASLLAELGLLRLANMFRFSIFQPSKLLEERLTSQELQVVKAFHFDGKSLRAAQSELVGLKDWIESSKVTKLKCEVMIIMANRVDMILADQKSQKDWSDKWISAQSDFIAGNHGEIIKDEECDSMSLCVSKQILTAIKKFI